MMDGLPEDVVNRMIVERRNFPRIPVSLEVSFRDGEEVLSSYLFDLGQGGLFIGSREPLPVGCAVHLSFCLPGDGVSLAVAGTVIWQKDAREAVRPGMGVRFDDMSREDRERIDSFLMEQFTR